MKYKQTLNFIDTKVQENLNEIFSKNGVPNTIIEVGSFEGITSCYISDVYGHVTDIKIYCIDPHHSNDLDLDMSIIKENFLYNISICKNKNILHIPKKSFDGLLDCIFNKIVAEFIYIDGDHRSSTVLEDLVLAFNIIPVGGILLCDDVNWFNSKKEHYRDSPNFSPRMAIEQFIQSNWHRIEIINLPNNYQVALRKIKND